MTENVVRLTNVVKNYRAGTTEVQAVRGVSLSVASQSFTMIVGPSGSGKTTLLNLIGCIDRPTGGLVEIACCDVSKLGDNALSDLRAKKIGFIFQNFSLIPVLSAFENIEYPLLLAGVSPRNRKKAVMEMLAAVGLEKQGNRRPNELSGGQKQRVAIARALAKKPEFVIADEPTANLDTATGASVIALMRKMQVEYRTSFIFSTHDTHLISQADRTFSIRDGVLEHGGAHT